MTDPLDSEPIPIDIPKKPEMVTPPARRFDIEDEPVSGKSIVIHASPSKSRIIQIVLFTLVIIGSLAGFIWTIQKAKQAPTELAPSSSPTVTALDVNGPKNFNNILNGYTLTIPTGMEIFSTGLAQNPSNSEGVAIGPSISQPHISLYSFHMRDFKNKTLQEMAEANFLENTAKEKFPGTVIVKPVQPTTFLGVEAIDYILKSTGFVSPTELFMGNSTENYRIIWFKSNSSPVFENNPRYFLMILPDNSEFQKVVESFKFTP